MLSPRQIEIKPVLDDLKVTQSQAQAQHKYKSRSRDVLQPVSVGFRW